jgi:hypothetical protein
MINIRSFAEHCENIANMIASDKLTPLEVKTEALKTSIACIKIQKYYIEEELEKAASND